MEVGKVNGAGTHLLESVASNISAHQVVKAAHEELLQLMEQRAGIMKRIGTLKQTIAMMPTVPRSGCARISAAGTASRIKTRAALRTAA